ncbi:unnamed protein product [marine sediment metagenome]|uniref:Uncharacterized protein n=1 Tax=marine sediment metagenome TaxID=412755 RepID=X0WU36_9ZZZZ
MNKFWKVNFYTKFSAGRIRYNLNLPDLAEYMKDYGYHMLLSMEMTEALS